MSFLEGFSNALKSYSKGAPFYNVWVLSLPLHLFQQSQRPDKEDQFARLSFYSELSAPVTSGNTGLQNLLDSVGWCSVYIFFRGISGNHLCPLLTIEVFVTRDSERVHVFRQRFGVKNRSSVSRSCAGCGGTLIVMLMSNCSRKPIC